MTRTRQRKARLTEGEERYRQLMRMLPDAILIHCGGKCVFANEAATHLFGAVDPREMLGLNVLDLNEPDFREFIQQRINSAYGGEHEKFQEVKLLRLDGHPVDVEFMPLAITYQGLPAIQVVLRDLSYRTLADKARRHNEEHLRKIAKLEAVVNMAGGLAHDLNNVLTAILGHVSLASLASTNREEVTARLAVVEEGCQQVQTLVQQLLTLARGGTPPQKPQDLAKILKDAARLNVNCSKTLVAFSLPDQLWKVEADPVQLYRLFGNLYINASQAMPAGGTIQVQAKNLNEKGASEKSLPASKYVVVIVTDQGTGIAPEHLDKVFQPHFSTKPQGCGLGLATVLAIVTNHQGHINVESNLGKGTSFHIFLPANDREIVQVSEENRERHFGKG